MVELLTKGVGDVELKPLGPVHVNATPENIEVALNCKTDSRHIGLLLVAVKYGIGYIVTTIVSFTTQDNLDADTI
jgi:hypothetical protein